MTFNNAIKLINQLLEENKTNSPEDKEFNLQWISLIKKSIAEAISKKYKIEVKCR